VSAVRGALLALLALQVFCPPAVAQDVPGDPASWLARGDALRREARASSGRERLELRARAVGVYRALREHFPEARADGAEAAFRAGELLRADGDARGARSEFQAAAALATEAASAARAGLELGHLDRRAGLHAEALAAYLAVAGAQATPRPQRDRALLWVARSQADLDRPSEARATLAQLAREARDPCLRVEAHDERALTWIAEGDLEAAAGELDLCRRSLRARAAEETPQGERVRSALRRMRAVARLARAVAERDAGLLVER
jgi:tetratricopeptide (TPR) repeat protein